MAIEIFDTHQHLIYPDRFSYGWTGTHTQIANQAFTYDDYLAATAGAGITRALFMEVDADDPQWRDETHMISAMADDPKTIVAGVIANARPEAETGFDAWLDEVADLRVVGLRRICHTLPDELSTTSTFVGNIQKLAARNLTFDLCFMARQLPIATELVKQCPDVQFVLDHCGNPDIAGGAMDPWREDIRTLAAYPNVACKISGIIVNAPPAPVSADTLRPYMEHCIESFGWDRVVWGGDWPVCNLNGDIATWIAHTRTVLASEDEGNQRKLLHENAARIYGV